MSKCIKHQYTQNINKAYLWTKKCELFILFFCFLKGFVSMWLMKEELQEEACKGAAEAEWGQGRRGGPWVCHLRQWHHASTLECKFIARYRLDPREGSWAFIFLHESLQTQTSAPSSGILQVRTSNAGYWSPKHMNIYFFSIPK